MPFAAARKVHLATQKTIAGFASSDPVVDHASGWVTGHSVLVVASELRSPEIEPAFVTDRISYLNRVSEAIEEFRWVRSSAGISRRFRSLA